MTTPPRFESTSHNRGYLPHWEQSGARQFVTFRLADSLPREFVLARLIEGTETRSERVKRLLEFEMELDACRGECHLRDPRVASIVRDALHHFDGSRYKLLAWVIMPNHVHLVVELNPSWRLGQVVNSWKGWSARIINKLLGRTGRFWQPEYFDRIIRDADHFGRCVRYIENNPVKAGLCRDPKDWPFSSAAAGR